MTGQSVQPRWDEAEVLAAAGAPLHSLPKRFRDAEKHSDQDRQHADMEVAVLDSTHRVPKLPE